MTKFKILVKDKDTKQIYLEEVEGEPLPHGLFVYEKNGELTISDVKSGTVVKAGLKDRSEIKTIFKDEQFLNSLKAVRTTDGYKKKCSRFERLLVDTIGEVDLWG